MNLNKYYARYKTTKQSNMSREKKRINATDSMKVQNEKRLYNKDLYDTYDKEIDYKYISLESTKDSNNKYDIEKCQNKPIEEYNKNGVPKLLSKQKYKIFYESRQTRDIFQKINYALNYSGENVNIDTRPVCEGVRLYFLFDRTLKEMNEFLDIVLNNVKFDENKREEFKIILIKNILFNNYISFRYYY